MLKQAGNTTGQLRDNFLLAGQHGSNINGRRADTDAVVGKMRLGFDKFVRAVQQRFRRNTPDIEIGSTQYGFGILIGPHFNDRNLLTQLGGTNRAHVSRRA